MFDNENSTLTNVTIAGNSGSRNQADATGGVYINSGLTLVNVIIAGNTDNGTENDCVFDLGTVTDKGHNLEGGTSCGLTGTGDVQNANPLLGSLANNGGETDTRALLAGSPAIDAGDATACPPTDQRGVSRPQLSGCDIGAFELTPPPAPAPVPAPADTTKPTIHVKGIRRACLKNRVVVRVQISDASGIRSVVVKLDGKRIRRGVKKSGFKLVLDPRKLKAGKHLLQIVAVDNAGNRRSVKKRFTRCGRHKR